MSTWEVKIFDCNKNIFMFVWSCFVPCGMVCMQVVDAKLTDPENNNAALIAGLLGCCLGCIGGVINRKRLKKYLNIEGENISTDVFIWYCCPCCAATQEYIQTLILKKGNGNIPIWKALSN